MCADICETSMISIPASDLQVAQQSAKAATAEMALAQVAAERASETAQASAPATAAAVPPGVGGLVDRTA